MLKKWVNKTVLVGALTLSVVLAGCSSTKDEVVATVDGEKITKDELYEILVGVSGVEALDALIDEKIVQMEIKKADITISDEETDAEMANFIEEMGGEEAFDSALEMKDMKKEDFKKEIVQYLSIRKLMEPLVEVTDEEIQAYFEENKDLYHQEEQVEARHILVEDEALANDLLKQLKDGADFAELAKEHSTDGTAPMGGDLGFFPRGKMVPEFDEKVFSMNVGDVSDLVKTNYGYHIIEVLDKKEDKEASLEDVKEEIKDKLFENGMQTEYVQWLEEKRAAYKIENTLTDTESDEETDTETDEDSSKKE